MFDQIFEENQVVETVVDFENNPDDVKRLLLKARLNTEDDNAHSKNPKNERLSEQNTKERFDKAAYFID